MFVEDIRTELEAIVTRLDGDVLSPEDAEHLLGELTAIERIASAGKSVAARRVADSGRWRTSGERSEADWLAKQTGETVGAARGTLETAKKLKRCPKTAKAFRKGKLSKPQAEAIAGAVEADADAEDRLLGMAETSALGKLRDECDRVRAAKRDAESTHERIHRIRYWRKWTDRDGARMGQYKLTPKRLLLSKRPPPPSSKPRSRPPAPRASTSPPTRTPPTGSSAWLAPRTAATRAREPPKRSSS
jgi:hypothetical protein